MTRLMPSLQYLSIPATSLLHRSETHVKLPFQSDFLVLPQSLPYVDPTTGAISTQTNGDPSAAWGIRINDPSAPMLLFSASAGANLAVFEGQVTDIYICQLASDAGGSVTILIGKDCDLGFSGAVYL